MAERPEKILRLPGTDAVVAIGGDVGAVEGAGGRLEGAAAGEKLPVIFLIRVTCDAAGGTQYVSAAFTQPLDASRGLRHRRRP